MRYVASDSIRIFPTSNRGAGPTGTNWVTEHNLASIIANLVNNSRNNKGFVVSEGTNEDKTFADKDPVIFYLGGYLVETTWEAITNNTSDSKAKDYCSLINFDIDSSKKQVTASITIKNSSAAETNSLETSYNHLTGNDTGEDTLSETLSLEITGSDGKVPDGSRINFVHLLLDGGVIGNKGSLDIRETGTINNSGTINNTNIIKNTGTINNESKITGGNLTHVAIGPEGNNKSSFAGDIGASTLTGNLTATGYSITGGTISHVEINGDGGASSFTGNIGKSTLTDNLDANSKNISSIGTLSANTITTTGNINATGSISGATLEGDISKATVKTATAHNSASDNRNLAIAFRIDDGTL